MWYQFAPTYSICVFVENCNSSYLNSWNIIYIASCWMTCMQKGILLCVIDSSLTSEIVRILYAHAWCILLPDKSLILYTFADNFLQIIHTVFMISLSLYIQKVLKGSQIEGNSVISKNLFMNNYFNNSLFHYLWI